MRSRSKGEDGRFAAFLRAGRERIPPPLVAGALVAALLGVPDGGAREGAGEPVVWLADLEGRRLAGLDAHAARAVDAPLAEGVPTRLVVRRRGPDRAPTGLVADEEARRLVRYDARGAACEARALPLVDDALVLALATLEAGGREELLGLVQVRDGPEGPPPVELWRLAPEPAARLFACSGGQWLVAGRGRLLVGGAEAPLRAFEAGPELVLTARGPPGGLHAAPRTSAGRPRGWWTLEEGGAWLVVRDARLRRIGGRVLAPGPAERLAPCGDGAWVVGAPGATVTRVDGRGEPVARLQLTPSESAVAVASDGAGSLWLALNGAVLCVRRDRVVAAQGGFEGVVALAVR